MSREDLLQAQSVAVGDAWVECVRLDLHADDREATGGWPGTMREARARTFAHFSSDPVVGRHGALTADELERAVRVVYERARVKWLAFARADVEERP